MLWPGHALINALVASTFMVLSQAVQKITSEQMEGLVAVALAAENRTNVSLSPR